MRSLTLNGVAWGKEGKTRERKAGKEEDYGGGSEFQCEKKE